MGRWSRMGLAVLIRPWQYSTNSLVFTIGLLLGQLNLALFAHVTLAYPAGVLNDRLERLFVKVSYVVAVGFPLAILLVADGRARLVYAPLAPDSLLLVSGNPELARELERAFVLVGYGVLTACFVALIVRKLMLATPAARRILSPLLLAALLAASARADGVHRHFRQRDPLGSRENEYWWQVAGQIALPLMLLAGLLSSRLSVAHVADLVRSSTAAPRPTSPAPSGARSATRTSRSCSGFPIRAPMPIRTALPSCYPTAIQLARSRSSITTVRTSRHSSTTRSCSTIPS